jgi:very-short-patch-repair endonuclease
MSQSKFHPIRSCPICAREITIQNLARHIESHQKTNDITSLCLECNSPIFNKANKFCNRSCAAKYNNKRKDYTKIRPGPKKGTIPKKEPLFTKINWCTICGKLHFRSGKSCSRECQNINLSSSISIGIKRAIENGYKPNLNRNPRKKSYLESSFESWLNSNYPNIEYEMEKPFKNTETNRFYMVDFYFPSLNLVIELDGTQHEQTIDYDKARDEFLTSTYGVKVIRITGAEYIKKEKLELVISLLN